MARQKVAASDRAPRAGHPAFRASASRNRPAFERSPPRLMARSATGHVETRQLADGTVSHRLSFRVHGRRERVTLRDVPRQVADDELELILAKIKAGVFRIEDYRAPEPAPAPDDEPTFHLLASECMAEWKADLKPRAYETSLWLLQRHLLPFFAPYTPSQINRRLIKSFRAQKLREREDFDALRGAGVPARGRKNSVRKGLGPRKLNQAIELLGRILDEAIDRELIDHNPARDRRLRRKVPKLLRTFLELDELADLLEAAEALEADGRLDERVAAARAMRASGAKLQAIAERFQVTVSTASHWCRHEVGRRRRLGWKTLVVALGYGGLRISELVELRWRFVHLGAARLWVADAKTETGRREVQLSPVLVEALVAHRQQLLAHGLACAPDDPVFPSQAGTHLSDDNVRARIIRPAVARANLRREREGLPPLPAAITPQSLRRTYISIALMVSGYDLQWVMAQVGHADSDTTTKIYEQLQKRRNRDGYGAAFDAVVARAKELLGASDSPLNSPSLAP
jgi:integrase